MEKISVHITTKTLLTILGIVVGVFVAWKLKNFLMIVILSVIIASFVEAGVKTFKKIKIPRYVSVFVLYILGFFILGGIVYLITPLFIRELSQFIDLFPKNSSLVKLIGPLADNGFTSGTFQEILNTRNLTTGSSDVVAVMQSIFGGLMNFFLVVIISFYLAIQEKGVEQFLRVITPEKYEIYVVGLWERVDRKIGYWFGGQVLVALLVGIITYIGLFILGVPYALILAALAALFVFIPFGTAFSVAPAVVLGYLGGGVSLAVQIFVFYGIVHYIESYFFTPYILHRTIGMPMLVIILAIIACFELFGLVGVVIAVPVAVLILELVYDYGSFTKKNKLSS